MGEGVYAYRIEYKTTTTTLLSSSSPVYLPRVLATSLTATGSCSPVESFVALGPCVRVVVVCGCWSFDSRCGWSSRLLCLLCVWLSIGWLSSFTRPGLVVLGVA